jgi:glyoxylase-like metal-dependent hydrolase (beta-lactamase superfamily II)
MKRAIGLLVAVLVIYGLAYAVLRARWAERWDHDGQTYVLFPEGAPWTYYAFRPIAYADGALTGIRFHIGPHREAARPSVPTYEVYAVRFGTLVNFPTSELVAGADKARRTDGAFMVWVLKNADRTVLVDAGFYRDQFVKEWKPADYRKPSDALKAAGFAPESVTDIVVSHIHWDHVDGADLFPNARVWIQKAEYEHYVGADGKALDEAIAPTDAVMLARLRESGRVELVPGDAQEILPGIRVFTGGKHTFESQYAAVATRGGTVVIASDNAYLYENLEKHVPIGATLDAKSNLAAQGRMFGLASDKRLVIPGHDIAVFERFPQVAPGVARID